LTTGHPCEARHVGNIRDRDASPGFAVRYVLRGGDRLRFNGAATTPDKIAGAGSNLTEQPLKRNIIAKVRGEEIAPRFAP
jgi:hypothetical protein